MSCTTGISIYSFLLTFNSNIWLNSAPFQDIRLWNVNDLDKSSMSCTTGIPMYGFLVTFNSNIWLKSAPFQDIRLWNLNDLDIHLSTSLKVKYDCAIGLPIYCFLLMFNSNIRPHWAPLWDVWFQNVSDFEFDLWRSNLMVSLDSPYDFLFMYKGTACLSSSRSYYCRLKIPISYHWAKILALYTPTLTPGRFISKPKPKKSSIFRRNFSNKNEVECLNTFRDILLTDRRTHTRASQ